MISVLDTDQEFQHPTGRPLNRSLKDFLDEEVEERFFLSEEQQSKYIVGRSAEGDLLIRNCTKLGYLEMKEYDGIDFAVPTSKTRRGRVQQGKVHTLMTSCNLGTLIDGRFRRLTAREYWKLMGISEEDYNKASAVVSETQLYKQAGNGIVVDVLEAIFKEIYNQYIK